MRKSGVDDKRTHGKSYLMRDSGVCVPMTWISVVPCIRGTRAHLSSLAPWRSLLLRLLSSHNVSKMRARFGSRRSTTSPHLLILMLKPINDMEAAQAVGASFHHLRCDGRIVLLMFSHSVRTAHGNKSHSRTGPVDRGIHVQRCS